MSLVNNILLILILTSALSQVSAFHCRNVALNKTVRTVDGKLSVDVTNGILDYKCLTIQHTNYPEIIVDLGEKTEVSFLHLVFDSSFPTAKHNLRIGLRSWEGYQVDGRTKVSPLDSVCGEYSGNADNSIITMRCRYPATGRYLVVQGKGITSLPICDIRAYSYNVCRNLALGRSAMMRSIPAGQESYVFPLVATDGYKYEPNTCVVLGPIGETPPNTPAPWWSVDLAGVHRVGSVNIYYHPDNCIVKSFGGVFPPQRKPTNHVAFFNVNSEDCKSICESYQPCLGIDTKQVEDEDKNLVDLNSEGTKPDIGCFIHAVQESVIMREEVGPSIYHYRYVDRQCRNQPSDYDSDGNWATNGNLSPEYAKVLQRTVTINIGVHPKQPPSRTEMVDEAEACVYHKEYTFVGVTPITCERFIEGRRVTIEFVESTTIAFCEVEVFAKGHPRNLALGKIASQLETVGIGTASRAVDGTIALGTRANLPIPGLTYSSTEGGAPMWWYVDLVETYNIGYIFLYPLNIGWGNILAHKVGVRKEAPRDQSMALSVTCPYVDQGNTAEVHSCPENTLSQYVVVLNPISKGALQLSEVEVYPFTSSDCELLRTEAHFAIRVAEDVRSELSEAPTCLVEPLEGGEFTHLFAVSCTGFESGSNQGDYHYRYYVKSASHTEASTKTICESETMLIECTTDQTIDITAVFYGRLDQITCPSEDFMGNTSCSLDDAIDIVRVICQNQRTCSVKAPGQDPCDGTYKYLTLTYVCRGETLYEGPQSAMPPVFLSAGTQKDNYQRIIYIRMWVTGAAAEAVTVIVDVIVNPSPVVTGDSVDGLTRYLFNDTGETLLDDLLSRGHLQEAFTVMSSVANSLTQAREAANRTKEAVDKANKVQALMVSILSKINDTDTDTVLGKSKCLNDISDIDITQVETQAAASGVYVDLARYLKIAAYGTSNATTTGPDTTELEKVEKASKVVLRGAMKLTTRSTDITLADLDVIYEDDEFDTGWTSEGGKIEKVQKRIIVRKAMKAWDDVSSALLHFLRPGNENTTVLGDTLSQVLKKDSAARLSSDPVTIPGSGNSTGITFIKLPELGSSESDIMGIQFFRMSDNPYTWHSSGKQVNYDVVGLSVYREDGEIMRLKNLTKPAVISLPRKLGITRGTVDVNLKMSQDDGSFRLEDLERFTADVVCNKNYEIIFSPHTNNFPESIFLIIKTDVKVFVRDFFRDSREETNITLLVVSFQNETTYKAINESTPAGLEYTVEGRGVVSLFGRMIEKTTRCQLHIGMLPALYDSTRCELCEGNSRVCGFCNSDVVVKREDSSETEIDKFLGISVATYINDCLYWEEDAEVWTNDGCKVSPRSTAATIECECHHLSIFSANMLVSPNNLDSFHLSLFLGVFENPIVVVVVFVAWCIYALLMVWARRKDRSDLMKQGVIVISTGTGADYNYLVTVITGWQRNAGTSATIAMDMIGSLGVIDTLVLTDPTRCVHESGAEAWFLVATDETLGELSELRVWHDCSGIFPSWFLKQITVRDTQTNQVWDFVCDGWLTPELGIQGIKRTLHANEDQRSRMYDFRLTSMQILRSEHPWVSIFSRPVYTTFNRAQRLSCVMSFVMIAMLTSIMFYGQPPVDIEEGALGGIAITMEQLIVGVESFLICLPSTMLIIAIFTNTRPHEERDLCIEFDVVATKKSFWKKKDSSGKNNADEPKPDGFDDDLRITLREMSANTSSNARRYDSNRTPSSSSIVSSSYPSGAVTSAYTLDSSSLSSDVSLSDVMLHEAENSKGCLPWWFVYIAWGVTVGTALVSSFVTIMYSLTYGYARSVAWTVSFISTFFQDTGIFEPIKTTAAAAFVTFISRVRARPNVPDSYTLNRGVDETRVYDDDNSSATSTTGLLPTKQIIRTAASLVKKEHRMWKLCHDAALPILISIVLAVSLNSEARRSAYLFRKSLMDSFVHARYGTNLAFTEVRTTNEMWRYIKRSFVPALDTGDGPYIADGTNILVGIARMRQLRIVPDLCSISHGHSCFTPYNFDTEDKSSYSPLWRNLDTSNTSYAINQSPWIYHSADETETPSTWGRHRMFSGGGYIVPLWSIRRYKMAESLEKLQNASWIDEMTRAVFLEFTVFNPRTNLFASTTLFYEFTDVGVIDSRYCDIVVHKVYTVADVDDIYRVVFEAIYVLLMAVYAVKTVCQFWRMRHKLCHYVSTIWPVVDCVVILLTLALVPVVALREEISRRVSQEILEYNRTIFFISFYQIALWDAVHAVQLCAAYFLSLMIVLKWSVYLGKLNMLFAFNVIRVKKYILNIACLIFVAFAMTAAAVQASFPLFCDGFGMMMTKAIMRVAGLFRYSAVCDQNECEQDSPSLLFFAVASFFVVLLWRALVLTGGITAHFTVVPLHERTELRFVDFLMSRILIAIGYCNANDFTAHEAAKKRRSSLKRSRTRSMSVWS